MIDAKRLIEQLLSGVQGGQPQDGTAASPRGHAANQAPGGLSERASGALGSASDYARRNPLLVGTLAGGLASIVFGSKTGRRIATTALTYGGIAAIGGLAYKAYQDYRARQARPADSSAPAQQGAVLPPPPADSPFAIENASQGAQGFALELVTAMINAAKADGHIDDAERAKIHARLSEGGLDEEERAFLSRELAAPLDIERVVKAATNKEEAIELFTASCLAITSDHPAEQAYLAMLAARLGLEPELARSVEQTVANART